MEINDFWVKSRYQKRENVPVFVKFLIYSGLAISPHPTPDLWISGVFRGFSEGFQSLTDNDHKMRKILYTTLPCSLELEIRKSLKCIMEFTSTTPSPCISKVLSWLPYSSAFLAINPIFDTWPIVVQSNWPLATQSAMQAWRGKIVSFIVFNRYIWIQGRDN